MNEEFIEKLKRETSLVEFYALKEEIINALSEKQIKKTGGKKDAN